MEAIKAIKIDKKDNVAVVLRKVEKGWGVVWTKDGETASVQAMDTIPMYHKIAVRDIPAGEPVVKYGEHIGIAGDGYPCRFPRARPQRAQPSGSAVKEVRSWNSGDIADRTVKWVSAIRS